MAGNYTPVFELPGSRTHLTNGNIQPWSFRAERGIQVPAAQTEIPRFARAASRNRWEFMKASSFHSSCRFSARFLRDLIFGRLVLKAGPPAYLSARRTPLPPYSIESAT